MRNILFVTAIFMALTVNAQLRLPAQSASATVKQMVGLTEIEVLYSRPSVRDRTIFGDLLPYGESWRVGANQATKITFSDAVIVDGKEFSKGSYAILAIPGAEIWLLNWYSYDSTDWTEYEKRSPLVQLRLPVVSNTILVESLEIHFQDVTMESAVLLIEWERSRIEIPIRVNEQEKILKTIDRTLAGPGDFDYYFSALYLHETQIQLEKALMYIRKVTDSKSALFFQVSREAMILNDLGRKKEAIEVAKRALDLSKKAGNKDFVRINTKIINQ